MKLSQIVKKKEFPTFIRREHIHSNFELDKWFRFMGVKNSSLPLTRTEAAIFTSVKPHQPRATVVANHLVQVIAQLTEFSTDTYISTITNAKRQASLNEILSNLREIKNNLGVDFKASKSFQLYSNKKIKSGTFLIPLINKELNSFQAPIITDHYSIDDLESVNGDVDAIRGEISPLINKHPAKKQYKVVFSADGARGAWDIATMSMRGIHSCMRWTNENSYSLVGSISDPCCGVIYITDGTKTPYGELMLARSVVRIVEGDLDNPTIFIDAPYVHDTAFTKGNLEGIFLRFFKKKLNKAFKNKIIIARKGAHYPQRPVYASRRTIIDSEFSSYMDAENDYTELLCTPKSVFSKGK